MEEAIVRTNVSAEAIEAALSDVEEQQASEGRGEIIRRRRARKEAKRKRKDAIRRALMNRGIQIRGPIPEDLAPVSSPRTSRDPATGKSKVNWFCPESSCKHHHPYEPIMLAPRSYRAEIPPDCPRGCGKLHKAADDGFPHWYRPSSAPASTHP